jgi:hypothetical protein
MMMASKTNTGYIVWRVSLSNGRAGSVEWDESPRNMECVGEHELFDAVCVDQGGLLVDDLESLTDILIGLR